MPDPNKCHGALQVLPAGGAAARPLQSFASVTRTSSGSAGLPAAGAQVKFGAPVYDMAKSSLTIPGLAYQLACPDGLQVSWDCMPLPGALSATGAPAAMPQTAAAG